MIDRRSLIGVLAGSLVATPGRVESARTNRLGDLGVQLYTVRHELQRDFEGTLAAIAAIGYREVEFVDLFGHAPVAVRAMLDRNGLAAPSSHVGYEALDGGLAATLEAAHALGHGYIVCAWIGEELRRKPDIWQRAAERFNRAGEISKKSGVQFAYHNHDFEFMPVGGRLPYDLLLAETDADLVKMELDLYWIAKGGQDPVAYFERWPGRFPLVHVKDMGSRGEMTEVGGGTIDFPRVLARAQTAAIRHYLVEHDNARLPMASVAASYRFLRRLSF